MGFRTDVEAFFDGEHRWRNALVGGLAGGVGGAAGAFVDAGVVERTVVIAAVALLVAGALVLVLGHFDRRGESSAAPGE